MSFVNADNTATIDSDKDGLTNEEERLYGTNKDNPDSDGDGYSDGVEVKSGYNPNKPAPGDKITSSSTLSGSEENSNSNSQSLTEEFVQQVKSFTDSKGDGSTVTTTDIQSFINDSLADKVGEKITWDNLPQVETEKIKILKQPYENLGEKERNEAIAKDSVKYMTLVGYVLTSNLPQAVVSKSDLQSVIDDFQSRLATLSTTNPDINYFSDLGNRLELFLNQLNEIEVPENMLDLHIKFMRLGKGFLSLRESSTPTQDPVAQLIMLNKVQDLIELFVDFNENGLTKYLTELENQQRK